mgnify:CR=1 FL=1
MKLKTTLLGYLIAAIVFLPMQLCAADYYACQNSQNINGDTTWCTAAHRTGSCTGDGTYTSWATITTSDVLHANGCTVVIPNTASTKYDVSKITNKTDGTGTDGGQFTYVTAADYTPEVAADLETGGTTGACLAITGTSGAGLKIGYTEAITIDAGSAAAMYGVSDGHSGASNDVYIGHASYPATINGGSHATAYGMLKNGTGTTHVAATSTGAAGPGFTAMAGTVNYSGSCVGSNSANVGAGCNGGSSTVVFNFTGKDISGTHSVGIIGKVIYTPAATDYILRAKDASYTRGTVDEHAVEMPTDPGVSNVETGTTYGSFTGTLEVTGSGSSPYAY